MRVRPTYHRDLSLDKHKLYNNTNCLDLDFETLEKLCALLNVDVGDLLKFKPDE